MELAGRVALVTGAGRGIGRAIALALARAGCDVVAHYRESAAGAAETVAGVEEAGRRAIAVQADVSRASAVEAMVAAVLSRFGPIDVLVNNAGVYSGARFLNVSEEVWDRVLAINLKSVFLCCRAVAPTMLERGGAIVNIASAGGLSARPGYDPSVAYAASKAGIVMVTKRLALELAPRIRVNCVAPGFVVSKNESEHLRRRFADRAPLGRVGDVDDIADAVVFLVSKRADFITGQVLAVDGGLAIT